MGAGWGGFEMDGFMQFLAGWLTNHILVADMAYVPTVKGASVSEARGKG